MNEYEAWKKGYAKGTKTIVCFVLTVANKKGMRNKRKLEIIKANLNAINELKG